MSATAANSNSRYPLFTAIVLALLAAALNIGLWWWGIHWQSFTLPRLRLFTCMTSMQRTKKKKKLILNLMPMEYKERLVSSILNFGY